LDAKEQHVYTLSQRRLAVVGLVLAALALLVAAGGTALAAAEPDAPRVKYYLVTTSDAGRPNALAEIAARLLGDASRADEIVALNAGRPQPDGGTLTDGSSLRVGWALILPWDAVGQGVRYGVLPTPLQAAPTTPAPTTAAAGGPAGPTTPTGATPTGATPTGATPTRPTATTAPAGACSVELGPVSDGPSWAQQRLSPRDAWSAAGRGGGVVVAVVDSGVDARVPQLTGRVSGGVDIVSGTEGGTTDCLGSGTAMAALIVGDDEQQVIGVAPDATVLPVRVATDKPEASADDQAIAIQVAVSAGARVIAVGSYVDVTLPEVQQAINEAARHDVVVVVAGPVPDDGSLPPQVLRVGVLKPDGQLEQEYPPGTIDVVAPGSDVTSLGPGGHGPVQVSGAQYAVAFVAGTAALVRGASPTLRADEVVRQLRTTATPIDSSSGEAPPTSGAPPAAVVNPAEAVRLASVSVPSTMPRTGVAQPPAESGGGRGTLLVGTAVLVLLVVAGALLLRRRRPLPAAEWDGADQSTSDGWPPQG
jgi:membrane-anchored mycosin MYCP